MPGAVEHKKLKATCLGGFKLTFQKGQTSEFTVLTLPPTVKSQSLLAFLILQRENVHSRERLMGMFWGDSPSRRARRSLSTALWHIRRCFKNKDPIQTISKNIQFAFEGNIELDVEKFEKYAVRETLSELQEAISLYKGEFLEGFYDDWITNERYRFESLLIEALGKIMVLQEGAGNYGQARFSAEKLLNLDPLREDAHQLLMRTFYAEGQRNSALEQYRICQQVLNDELGVDPTSETINLFREMQNGSYEAEDVSPKQPIPQAISTTPSVRNPFDIAARSILVGRENELNLLSEIWNGTRPLVMVIGEAGIGKTSLLESFANYLNLQGVRVLWGRCYEFERLLPYQPIAEALQPGLIRLSEDELSVIPSWVLRELENLIPELVEHLSKPGRHYSAKSDQDQLHLFSGVLHYISVLSESSPLLLVLEDLHWAAESTTELLHYLIRHAPPTKFPTLFICSYRPESLPAQHHVRTFQRQLQRDDLVQVLNLPPLSSADVEQLLIERSGENRAIIPLAHRLYQETEGNPFYLEETIKALFEMNAISIYDGIWQGEFDNILKGDLPLPSTISAVIQARVGRMSEATQDALQNAAVLGRKFDFDLLNTIWGKGNEQTLNAIDEMLRRRVIEEETDLSDRDYKFSHHKIQEVIYEQIPHKRRQSIHGQAGEAFEKLFVPHLDEVMNELAHHYFQAQQFDTSLTDKASRYLYQAGNLATDQFAYVDAKTYYKRALKIIPDNDVQKRYDIHAARERIYDVQGNRETQKDELATLWKLAKRLSAKHQSEIKLREARLGREVGDYDAAIEAAKKAIDLAEADQTILIAEGNLIIGQALIRQGNSTAAQPKIQKGIDLAREADAGWLEASCLNNLGLSYYYLGESSEAFNCLEEAVQKYRQIEDLRGLSATLNNLGVLANQQAKLDAAKAYYNDALEIHIRMGNRKGEGMTYNNLGVIAFSQGDFLHAKQYYDLALKIAREFDQRLFEANAQLNLGNVFFSLGAHDEAKNRFETAVGIYRQIGNQTGEGWGLAYISLHAERLEEYELALSNAHDALNIADQIEDRHSRGLALTHLGHVLLRLDRSEEALSNYQKAVDLRRELDEDHLAIESLSGMLRVYMHQNNLDQVKKPLEECMQFIERNSLEGVDEPFRVYLTCFQALRASNDSRRNLLLTSTYNLLKDQAKKIDDEALQRSFLENIPVNREIAAAYAKIKSG